MRGEISVHFLKERKRCSTSLSSKMAADRGSAVFKAPSTLHSKLIFPGELRLRWQNKQSFFPFPCAQRSGVGRGNREIEASQLNT